MLASVTITRLSPFLACVHCADLHPASSNLHTAIDLIDEACASVKVQRETRPEAIDVLERKKLSLEVEVHALEVSEVVGSLLFFLPGR